MSENPTKTKLKFFSDFILGLITAGLTKTAIFPLERIRLLLAGSITLRNIPKILK